MGQGGYNNEGEARAWTRGGEGRVWTGKGGGGLLTLCLNSDFSSRVMVSALAMTGTMFTTLLRCFMNSRSRGRKLRPREGGVSEPLCPTPLSHCHHSRATLGTGGLGWGPGGGYKAAPSPPTGTHGLGVCRTGLNSPPTQGPPSPFLFESCPL